MTMSSHRNTPRPITVSKAAAVPSFAAPLRTGGTNVVLTATVVFDGMDSKGNAIVVFDGMDSRGNSTQLPFFHTRNEMEREAMWLIETTHLFA